MSRIANRDRFASGQGGFSIVATLLVLALVGILAAATVSGALTSLRTATADYRTARAFYVAEAGAEAALSQIRLALQDGYLSDSELADIQAPPMEGYTFSEFQVVKDGPVITETLTDGAYAGLYALTQHLEITAAAEDEAGNASTVVLGAKAQAIPLFQFAVFFEGAGEDYAGARKDVTGRFHANGDLFLGGKDLHFHKMVTTPNRVHRDHRWSHADPDDAGVYIEDASGNDVKLTFDSDDTPDPDLFKAKSIANFDGRLQTNAFGVDSLKLPLPPTVAPREVIRPREPGSDTEAEMATKFAWNADMYVTVDLTDIRSRPDVCGGGPPNGLPDLLPNITVTRDNGGVSVPSQSDKCDIFRWEWEAFFDNAEEKWIDVLDVDVSELRDWINGPGDDVRLVYVEIKPSASISDPSTTDPSDDGKYSPVLRVKNGAELPGPFTVGSEYPLYMWGDYNSINKQPAAVFGDRLMVLSNNWDDDHWANQNDTDSKSQRPNASDTEQYFAVVTGTGEGYIGCFHEDPGCVLPPYGGSGWVINLENWKNPCSGRCKHTMIGSFISLWAPQIATPYGGYPGTNYYKAPDRNWSFDPDLLDPANLPPGTPSVGQVFRAAFRETL